MHEKRCIFPAIFPDSVKFDLYDKCIILIADTVECLFDFSPLKKVIAWKLFIIEAFDIAKCLIEDAFSIRAIVELIKHPSAIKLNHSISV